MRNDAPHLVLQRLVRTLNETCNIGTLLNGEVIYLDRVEAEHWPLRLHYTSARACRCIAAPSASCFWRWRRSPRRQRLLQSLELRRYTDHTITDKTKLEAELRQSARSRSRSTARNIWLGVSARRCR